MSLRCDQTYKCATVCTWLNCVCERMVMATLFQRLPPHFRPRPTQLWHWRHGATAADIKNSKWRPPKPEVEITFQFRMSDHVACAISESGVVENFGITVGTASPSPSVHKLSLLLFSTCRFSSVKLTFCYFRSVETRGDEVILQSIHPGNWHFKSHLSTWSDSGAMARYEVDHGLGGNLLPRPRSQHTLSEIRSRHEG